MEGSGTDNQHNDEYFDTHSFVKLEDLHSWQNRTTNSNSSMCTNPLSSVEQFILGTDGQEGKIKWSYNIDPKEIHLEKQLGNGTFGSVWQAKCRGVDVAVKVLVRQDLDEQNLKSFKKEVEILSGIRAPNIVLFFGASFVPGQLMIVTELMTRGDLDTLLHTKSIALSLWQRMKMARDVAAGLLWLHENNPQILHRDLKPGNLLVDKESSTIKLCDFGLSAVKPNAESFIESTIKPVGTPYWMAPEVMLEKLYSTKSDVYSFGIILWQLLTRQAPFMQIYRMEDLVDTVCNKKGRPTIPDGTPQALADLIDLCWHHEPSLRPEFKEIVPALDEIILRSAIHDTRGANFWKNNFGTTQSEVPWDDFWNSFADMLPTATINEENVDCLYRLLGLYTTTDSDSRNVHIENFGKVLDWFGPLEVVGNQPTLLQKIRSICSKKWFFGDISTKEAADRLSGEDTGTFLIRFSTSQPGSYTLSRVDNNNNIVHTRIPYEHGHFIADGKKFNSIVAVVEDMKVACKKACSGSMFHALFTAQHDVGYE